MEAKEPQGFLPYFGRQYSDASTEFCADSRDCRDNYLFCLDCLSERIPSPGDHTLYFKVLSEEAKGWIRSYNQKLITLLDDFIERVPTTDISEVYTRKSDTVLVMKPVSSSLLMRRIKTQIIST